MAEALEDGIHETGVAVVPQADHTRYRVRWPNEPIGRRWRWNTISALLVALDFRTREKVRLMLVGSEQLYVMLAPV